MPLISNGCPMKNDYETLYLVSAYAISLLTSRQLKKSWDSVIFTLKIITCITKVNNVTALFSKRTTSET